MDVTPTAKEKNHSSKEDRVRKVLLTGLMCAALLFLPGCGAMFQGSNQTIGIQSAPSGAKVTGSPGIGEYTTPASVTLSRKHSYDLTFTKDGYRPATAHIHATAKFGYILLDVLFTGLVGVIIDAATGSWNGLSPETVIVTLDKEEMGAIGPDIIEVQLSAVGSDLMVVSDGPPVQVMITKSK